MSHTQVRADEATTNHEENNYALFNLRFEPPGRTAGSHRGKPNKAKADTRRHILRVPLGRGRGGRVALGEWDTDGEVHNLPIMARLREELQMQMRSIHSRHDCVRKVMIRNPDLQKLPLRQAQGALQRLWCDWTYSNMSQKAAQKTISRENARRMIDTSSICLLYTSPSPRDS